MPRVKPEVIYEPLASLIRAERAAGYSDYEIYEGIKARFAKLRELGYSGEQIAQFQSSQITTENQAKTFARGLVEGLTLGYYVPSFLEHKPSEIKPTVDVPILGETSLGELGGQIVGAAAPGGVLSKVARPLIGARVAAKAGPVAGVAAQEAAVGGVMGAGYAGQAPEERLLSGGLGAVTGGVIGGAVAAAPFAKDATKAALSRVRPSRVQPDVPLVRNEPSLFPTGLEEATGPGVRVPPAAQTRRMLPPSTGGPTGLGEPAYPTAYPREPLALEAKTEGRIVPPHARTRRMLEGGPEQRALGVGDIEGRVVPPEARTRRMLPGDVDRPVPARVFPGEPAPGVAGAIVPEFTPVPPKPPVPKQLGAKPGAFEMGPVPEPDDALTAKVGSMPAEPVRASGVNEPSAYAAAAVPARKVALASDVAPTPPVAPPTPEPTVTKPPAPTPAKGVSVRSPAPAAPTPEDVPRHAVSPVGPSYPHAKAVQFAVSSVQERVPPDAKATELIKAIRDYAADYRVPEKDVVKGLGLDFGQLQRRAAAGGKAPAIKVPTPAPAPAAPAGETAPVTPPSGGLSDARGGPQIQAAMARGARGETQWTLGRDGKSLYSALGDEYNTNPGVTMGPEEGRRTIQTATGTLSVVSRPNGRYAVTFDPPGAPPTIPRGRARNTLPTTEEAGATVARAGVPETVAETLEKKGLAFKVDRADIEAPYTVVGQGGVTKRFNRLSDVIAYSDSLADDIPPLTTAKVIQRKKLGPTEQQRVIQNLKEGRYVAEQPMLLPETDPPPIKAPPMPPKSVPPIGGGAFAGPPAPRPWLGPVLKNLSRREQESLIAAVDDVAQAHPGSSAILRESYAQPKSVTFNPLSWVGQPTSLRNPVIRAAASDAVETTAALDHATQWWKEFGRKAFGGMTEAEDKLAAQIADGKAPLSSGNQTVREAVAAWRQAADDFAQRFGIPEWGEYFTHLVDKQKVYQDIVRAPILGARTFDDLSASLQEQIGSATVFNRMRKAFEKQTEWTKLPRDVRQDVEARMLLWNTNTRWDTLPQHVKDKVPKEIFDRFLEPRVGGLPVKQSMRESFDAYVPIALKKIYLDPYLARWQPIANTLPGRSPIHEGPYLRKYLAQIHGAVDYASDDLIDGIVRSAENSIGRSLMDPQILSRTVSRSTTWGYRGLLGPDSAFLNIFQGLNSWAESGLGAYGRGLGQYLSSGPKTLPKVGLLQDLDMFARGEFLGPAEWAKSSNRWKDQLRGFDDKVSHIALYPMQMMENFNRGVAFNAAVADAARRGASLTDSLQLGLAKASKVQPNLAMAQAQLEALHSVGRTQFGYSAAYRNPYMAGPLGRLTTMLWSYPTREAQFLINGIAGGLKDAMKDPNADNISRLFRFTVLTGLMTAGPIIGAQLGVDLKGAFGLLPSLFRRGFAGPMDLITGSWSLASTVARGEPVSQLEVDKAWRDWVNILIPQARYGREVIRGVEAVEKGYRTDELMRRTYDTTPWGEFTKALGIQMGDSYRARVVDDTVRKSRVRYVDERRDALNAALDGDFGPAETFNTAYPEKPLTGADLAAEQKRRATPLIERRGPMFLRRRVLDEEDAPLVGMGVTP